MFPAYLQVKLVSLYFLQSLMVLSRFGRLLQVLLSQMVVANVHSKVQKSITDFFASAPAAGDVSSVVTDERPIDVDSE
jgi:hypothetical protein